MSPRPLGTATIAVLQAIASGVRYGFDICDRTGQPSGTVYPALSSLEGRGLVTSRWESAAVARTEARPRRRYYRITAEGRVVLADALRRLESLGLGGLSAGAGRVPDGGVP
jgi:DNA-binding PadR family transcriptional regulator